MEQENTVSVEDLYEQMKTTVRQSFTRLYAALKARELRTLRQLQAVRRLCQSSHPHDAACLRSLHISYDNEEIILAGIENYGQAKLDSLNLNRDTFSVEDYISPEDDHMYSYKDIDEIAAQTERLNLDIEEAALRQITSTGNCVCSVRLTAEDISKHFRHDETHKLLSSEVSKCNESLSSGENEHQRIDQRLEGQIKIEENHSTGKEPHSEEKHSSIDESSKTNPTEEWLNCIKSQIETEPTQVTDVMEHSVIIS